MNNIIQNNIKKREVNIENIKSTYILKRIFVNFQKNRLLQIIKHNKRVQKKLNINVNDYKYFNDIEIELIPKNNEYGLFINILNEREKFYYHIYFNDSNEEIKTTKFKKYNKIQKIKIIINPKVSSFHKLFENCQCIESINFKKFYSDNITNMSYMFSGCSSLKQLNFSSFNTSNVTDMSYMFSGCISLKKLNLSNFNTNKVTNMRYMFSGCSSLKKLNLSGFNVNDKIDMSNIFFNCPLLKDLNLFNTDSEKVKKLIEMLKYSK